MRISDWSSDVCSSDLEVADAIERRDLPALKDELGDLLLQVVYHSQMESEAGAFSIDDVISAITDKMIRRHPHVFGEGESAGWENTKAAERATSSQRGALEDVALALPASHSAEMLQKRAATERSTGHQPGSTA